MVKVCHVTSAHNPEDVRIFHKECVSLAKAGYTVCLVERGETYKKNNVSIIGFGEYKGNRFGRMTKLAKRAYLAAKKSNADIYHIHDPELLPYALKLKKQGKIVIFDSHENTAEAILEKTWIPKLVRKLVHRVYYCFQKYVCERLDCVIVATENMAPYFENFSKRVVAITNFPILKEAEMPDYSSRTIVFAGGISEQWNHENIINALNTIPNSHYILMGSAGNEYLNRLKGCHAWKNVNYLGIVNHSRVPEELKKAAVGVAVLSYGHNTDYKVGTMGNTKIFEEMMAELPVVCTDFQLWKDFIQRYHCGICVNPHDVDEIRKAISTLIDDPGLAMEMGKNGRLAVEKEFNWSIEEKKLVELYKSFQLNNKG